MTDLRLTLRRRKVSPLTSNEADADLEYLAQLSVPKWNATDAALVGAYTNGIIVDSAATGARFQLKTGGTPTVNPDTDTTEIHWLGIGSSSDASIVEARAVDPVGSAPSAGKAIASFDGKLYTVVGGVYAEFAPTNAQALIDLAENYIPVAVGSNTRVGAVNPADWTAGAPGADDVIEYLYTNGSSDVFVHDGANWGVTPIYTAAAETDERITIDPAPFLYSSTPQQSDFNDWLTADQVGAQTAGAGDTLQATTTEGHIYSCNVYRDKITTNLVTSAVTAEIPFGTELQALPVNLADWRPGWVITTKQDTGDAPAADYEMNLNNTSWVPTLRSSNYLGGGGSVNAGITQAELDAALMTTIGEWQAGNARDVVYVTVMDGVTPVFAGNARIRTGGDKTIDPLDLGNGGPNNWRLDLNRVTTWNVNLGPYFDEGDLVEHNSIIYQARAGGVWGTAPTGATDVNWLVI